MVVALSCLACPCEFSAAPDTPADEVLERMAEEGPWFALAAGETFEDMIFTALAQRGRILCPQCRRGIAVNESSFGDLAREMMIAG
jgi:hypothetical protein